MIFFFLSLVDAYLNHPLLSLCDPKRIRGVLCENMKNLKLISRLRKAIFLLFYKISY